MTYNFDFKQIMLGNRHSLMGKVEIYDREVLKTKNKQDKFTIPSTPAQFRLLPTDPWNNLNWSYITTVYNHETNVLFALFTPEYSLGEIQGVSPKSFQFNFSKDKGVSWQPVASNSNILFNVENYVYKYIINYDEVSKAYYIVYSGKDIDNNDVIRCKKIFIKYNTEFANYSCQEVEDYLLLTGYTDFTSLMFKGELNVVVYKKPTVEHFIFNIVSKTITDRNTIGTYNFYYNMYMKTDGVKFYLGISYLFKTATYSSDKTDYYLYDTVWIKKSVMYRASCDMDYNKDKETFAISVAQEGNIDQYSVVKSIGQLNSFTDIEGYNEDDSTGPFYGFNNNYKIVSVEQNDFVVFWVAGTTVNAQNTFYTETQTQSDALAIIIQPEKIMKAQWDIINEAGTTRALGITISNIGNYFDNLGIDSITGVRYADVLNSNSIAKKTLVFYVGDKNLAEDKWEVVFTGAFIEPRWIDEDQTCVLECEDMLWYAKTGDYGKKHKHVKVKAEDLTAHLLGKCGLTDIDLIPSNYTIDNIEYDENENIMDNIMKIMSATHQKIYCDRFGTIRTMELSEERLPVFDFTPADFYDIQKNGPTAKEAINVVRIITDNSKDPSKYVEARNEEAIRKMGRQRLMILDLSDYFPTNSAEEDASEETNFTYPSGSEVDASQYFVGADARPDKSLTDKFMNYHTGKYEQQGHWVYVVRYELAGVHTAFLIASTAPPDLEVISYFDNFGRQRYKLTGFFNDGLSRRVYVCQNAWPSLDYIEAVNFELCVDTEGIQAIQIYPSMSGSDSNDYVPRPANGVADVFEYYNEVQFNETDLTQFLQAHADRYIYATKYSNSYRDLAIIDGCIIASDKPLNFEYITKPILANHGGDDLVASFKDGSKGDIWILYSGQPFAQMQKINTVGTTLWSEAVFLDWKQHGTGSKPNAVVMSDAQKLADYYLGHLCRTTTTLTTKMRPHWDLEPYLVAHIEYPLPYVVGNWLMKKAEIMIDFTPENPDLDFTVHWIDE